MFTDNDLRDPAPPVPGAPERAKVAVRAKQIKRHRRLTAAGGALGLVAVMSVGAVALSGGGSSGSGTSRIEVAGTSVVRETVPTTVAPVPTTVAPVPDTNSQATTQEAPAVQETPAPAPSVFTISGSVANIPAGATLTVTLRGANGTFSAVADGSGNFSIGGVPAGDYSADYSWVSSDGSASQAGRLPAVSVSGDVNVSFSL